MLRSVGRRCEVRPRHKAARYRAKAAVTQSFEPVIACAAITTATAATRGRAATLMSLCARLRFSGDTLPRPPFRDERGVGSVSCLTYCGSPPTMKMLHLPPPASGARHRQPATPAIHRRLKSIPGPESSAQIPARPVAHSAGDFTKTSLLRSLFISIRAYRVA